MFKAKINNIITTEFLWIVSDKMMIIYRIIEQQWWVNLWRYHFFQRLTENITMNIIATVRFNWLEQVGNLYYAAYIWTGVKANTLSKVEGGAYKCANNILLKLKEEIRFITKARRSCLHNVQIVPWKRWRSKSNQLPKHEKGAHIMCE